MKKFTLLICSFALLSISIFGQNGPSIGAIDNDTIIINSGENLILLPDINDGDAGVDQSISFTVSSDASDTVDVGAVDYVPGNTFAVLHVTDQGLLGSATIDVTIDDGDNTANRSFDVVVGTYNKPGVTYQVHDIIFWKKEEPLDGTPIFDSVVNSTIAPSQYINWDNLELTVSQDCDIHFCDGHDFITTLFRGYIVPPKTGDYVFYQISHDADAMWLSMDADINNADPIIGSGTGYLSDSSAWSWDPDTLCNEVPIGDDCPPDTVNEFRSDTISLTGGNVYAFYAIQWNVHFDKDTIYWTGPGISKEPVPGENLMFVYDTIYPQAPSGLEAITTASNYIRVKWNPGSDNKELSGYNVYVNGYKNNTSLLTDTSYNISGLDADTTYSIVVTSVDAMGNESALSNIITQNTQIEDNTNPSPPTSLTTLVQTGMALEVAWTGHSDGETEVVAFNLFLNDTLYNTTDYIWDTSTIIKVLEPETTYEVKLQAIDAGDNLSDTSIAFQVTTSEFDINSPDLTVKTGRLKVKMENISYNYGIGANPNFTSTELYTTYKPLLQDMRAGAVRWGALTANPLNFSTNINTSTSIGDFINLCNELDAYTAFTCGVSGSTDWRTDEQTFLDFLEYINGPAGTTYGDIRESEGYGPLLDNSKGLIFEFGNEVWGFGAHNASFADYEEYGQWCRDMAEVMRTSPYWDEDKIFLTYSGRNPHPQDSYGLHGSLMEGDTGDVDWLAVSGYLGPTSGWETRLEYYKNTVEAVARDMQGLKMTMQDALALTGDIKETYFYEGNMTTSAYNGRLGQAVIFTDYCLASMEYGSAIPTIFHLTGGQWRITSPAEGYKRLPLFITAKYFNMYCRGDVLKTKYQTQYEITDASGYAFDFDPVGGYAYTDSVNYSVVLLSRDFENSHYVQLDLPDDLNIDAPSGKSYTISGSGFSTFDATIDSSTFTMKDSLMFEVPPYSMVLVTFTGDDQQFEQLPLANFDDYVRSTNIEIICQENTHTITQPDGRLRLATSITPDSSFVQSAIWEVIGNDVGVQFYNGLVVAPDSAYANDTIIFKATSGDREVYDTFKVFIKINTDIEDNKAEDEFVSVYPVPADDLLNISFKKESKGIINLVNAQGINLYSGTIDNTGLKIDVSDYDPGIYFVKILVNNEKAIIRKFIKD